jgi:V8-like Glu-specific endopeptidase
MRRMLNAVSLLVCVIFASSFLEKCNAVNGHVDDEDFNTQESGDNENVQAQVGLGWVKHMRTGDLFVAKEADIERLSHFIETQKILEDGTHDLASAPPEEFEDGPEKDLPPSKRITKKSSPLVLYACQYEKITAINYYPEYAIGSLGNGCTAFMVGPHHAITAAHCVYTQQERLWEENLNFLRGKNINVYLQKLEWEHVIVPSEYYKKGLIDYNWALITFTKRNDSPVWLKFAYTPKPASVFPATTFGYTKSLGPNEMRGQICETMDKPDDGSKLLPPLLCHCPQFNGGPVMKGYDFMSSGKIAHVYGINLDSSGRYYGEQSNVMYYKALSIYSEMFWSLCYLLGEDGYDAKCGKANK